MYSLVGEGPPMVEAGPPMSLRGRRGGGSGRPRREKFIEPAQRRVRAVMVNVVIVFLIELT